MKFAPLVLVPGLALTLGLSPAEAHAARGGTITSQSLEFVSDTTITGPAGKPLALCMLTETTAAMLPGINMWRSVEGYGLSDTGCAGDDYYPLSAEMLAMAQQVGEIPAAIPAEPVLSFGQKLGGFWGLGALGLLGLFALAKKLGGGTSTPAAARKPSRRRGKGAVTLDDTSAAILQAMSLAAHADGDIACEELEEIREAAQACTGQALRIEQVAGIVELTRGAQAEAMLPGIVASVPEAHRSLLMEAVLEVVASDGEVSEPEWAFVQALATQMAMDGDTLRRLVAKTVQKQQAMAA